MPKIMLWGVFFLTQTALAAPVWQVILEESNKRIELDSTSIMREGNSVEATGRVVLARPLIDQKTGEEYRIIEAATRYHCDKKSASTLRRIYKRDENTILREETMNVVELPVRAGTLDNKVLSEVCRLNTENKRNTAPTQPALAAPSVVPREENGAKTQPSAVLANATTPPENTASEPTQNIRPQFAPSKRARSRRTLQNAQKVAQEKDLAELQNVAARLKAANEKLLKEELAQKKGGQPSKKVPQTKTPDSAAQPIANASVQNWHKKVAQSVRQKREPLPNTPRSAVLERTVTDWAYGGRFGPSHWADLRKEYRICRDGLRQSPIDIRGSIKGDLPALRPHYEKSAFRLVDLGYTLSVELDNAGFLELDNQRWMLRSVEFRRPGEEMVMGKRSDMSLHLMHQAADGARLILAIALYEGAENALIQTLWNALPLERKNFTKTAEYIDFSNILPNHLGYFTTMGSLTFPPCTENVQWVILKESQSISAEQMRSFALLYSENARPLQADNARIVKESR